MSINKTKYAIKSYNGKRYLCSMVPSYLINKQSAYDIIDEHDCTIWKIEKSVNCKAQSIQSIPPII